MANVAMKGLANHDYYASGAGPTAGAIYRADAAGNLSNVKTGVSGVAPDHVPSLLASGAILTSQAAWQ